MSERESWDIEQSRLLLKRPRSADTILIKLKKKILKRTKPATGGWEQACWSSNKVKSNPTACKGLQKAEHGVSGWNTVAMWETQMKLLLLACPSFGHFSHLGSEPVNGKPPSASPYLSVTLTLKQINEPVYIIVGKASACDASNPYGHQFKSQLLQF